MTNFYGEIMRVINATLNIQVVTTYVLLRTDGVLAHDTLREPEGFSVEEISLF